MAELRWIKRRVDPLLGTGGIEKVLQYRRLEDHDNGVYYGEWIDVPTEEEE